MSLCLYISKWREVGKLLVLFFILGSCFFNFSLCFCRHINKALNRDFKASFQHVSIVKMFYRLDGFPLA